MLIRSGHDDGYCPVVARNRLRSIHHDSMSVAGATVAFVCRSAKCYFTAASPVLLYSQHRCRGSAQLRKHPRAERIDEPALVQTDLMQIRCIHSELGEFGEPGGMLIQVR